MAVINLPVFREPVIYWPANLCSSIQSDPISAEMDLFYRQWMFVKLGGLPELVVYRWWLAPSAELRRATMLEW